MEPRNSTPEADALEQQETADGGNEQGSELPEDLGDRPEADTIEQSMVVEEDQVLERSRHRDDVPEADWLDQSIAEPFDDDR